MKVVILGAGLMGKEAARDLIQNEDVEKVYLADVDTTSATAFLQTLTTSKIEVLTVDANDEQSLKETIALGDIVLNALFYTFNEKVARTAIEVGVHYVDLGGHIGGATDAVLKMHEQAVEKNVTLIPDLGVAPGMMNILAGYGSEQLDETQAIKIYVGGIPVEPEPPLNYNLVFSLEGVFDHYTEPSHIIREGALTTVPSLSEVEPIQFEGYEYLEAFHTSGGTSTLLQSFQQIETVEYKTIRYQGHAKKFKLLIDLGLLDRNEVVQIDGKAIHLRDVMREQLMKKLTLGSKKDAVLLRVIVSGVKNGQPTSYTYELITEKDEVTNETAMARATANTLSIVAQMVGRREIQLAGVFPPEKIVPGKRYIEEMKLRDIEIIESVEVGQ